MTSLYLKADKDLIAIVTIDEDDPIPPSLRFPYFCDLCDLEHEAVFKHQGMHDDGEVYQLESISKGLEV